MKEPITETSYIMGNNPAHFCEALNVSLATGWGLLGVPVPLAGAGVVQFIVKRGPQTNGEPTIVTPLIAPAATVTSDSRNHQP